MNTANQLVVMPLEELIAILEALFTRFRNEQNSPYSGPTDDTKKIYTRNEVAAILRVNPNTVTRYHNKKLLHATLLNGQYRISEKELNRFINQKAK